MSGVSIASGVGSMFTSVTAAVVGYHAAVPEQAKAENSVSVSAVLLFLAVSAAIGALLYLAIKWYFEAEVLRMRIRLNDSEIEFLKKLLATRRQMDALMLDANAPSVIRCKAMVLMAAQSEGEESRTAAMLACRLIRDERLQIVALPNHNPRNVSAS